ncbi:MAG: T9SS type A sorting domain-containing protein, partial [Ignavibacteriaceae bacterium]
EEDEIQPQLPTSFVLYQNYPNPFNPTTSIRYEITSRQFVNLKVYNVLGKEVATLVNREQNPGSYSVNFDASNLSAGNQGLSSGVYFYMLKAGSEFVQTRKMILIKYLLL